MVSSEVKRTSLSETVSALPMRRVQKHFLKIFGESFQWSDSKEEFSLDDPTYKTEYHNAVTRVIRTFRKKFRKKSNFVPKYNQKANTIILNGETGCGKSTQVPQLVLEYLSNHLQGPVKILVTEPRRIAAISLAGRVQSEVGKNQARVSYTTRFLSNEVPSSKIVFVTEGILRQRIIADPLLLEYNVIIVDEAHERSISTDLILGHLKKLVCYRHKAAITAKREAYRLKVIIMTATSHTKLMQNYFPGSLSVTVPMRTFRIQRFNTSEPSDDYFSWTIATILKLHDTSDPCDHFLVFLTGHEEIEAAVKHLNSLRLDPPMLALPLYAALPTSRQRLAFAMPNPGTRKVVLATNIAETSVTISGISTVIDSGFRKTKRFIPSIGIDAFTVERISKSQAIQRSGRSGRERDGRAFHLFTSEEVEKLKTFDEPEIMKTSLTQMYLHLPYFQVFPGLFQFISDVNEEAANCAIKELENLQLIEVTSLSSRQYTLTRVGRALTRFPVLPRLAKVVLDSGNYGVINGVAAIAAMLETENVFADASPEKVHSCLEKFRAPEGDLITYLNIYRDFKKSSSKQDWCRQNNINPVAMNSASRITNQLSELVSRHWTEAFDHDLAKSVGGTPKEVPAITSCFAKNIPWNRAVFRPREKVYALDGFNCYSGLSTSIKIGRISPLSSLFRSNPPRIFFYNVLLNEKNVLILQHCVVLDKSFDPSEQS